MNIGMVLTKWRWSKVHEAYVPFDADNPRKIKI